jgi:predicted transcriptional regulator
MTATEILRKSVKKQIDNADEKSLKMVRAMLQAEEEYDWWDDLSEGAISSIEQGLKDAGEGKLTPHDKSKNLKLLKTNRKELIT